MTPRWVLLWLWSLLSLTIESGNSICRFLQPGAIGLYDQWAAFLVLLACVDPVALHQSIPHGAGRGVVGGDDEDDGGDAALVEHTWAESVVGDAPALHEKDHRPHRETDRLKLGYPAWVYAMQMVRV